MKLLVDKMPEKKSECFSEFMYSVGDKVYSFGENICRLDMKPCNLHDNGGVIHRMKCRWLKEIE